MSQGYVVRLRGLPWSTRAEQVMEFLRECDIAGGEDGVHFTFSREGRPSGECFVELASEDDVQNALAQNNEHIGSRYIEVFRVDRSEMEWMIKRAGAGASQTKTNEDAVVKLRGLPFGCTKEEIAHFFSGLEIVPNGIMLPADDQGRNSGEAFVQFASPEIAERSFGKDKELIGHRYIEIFKSDLNEANSMMAGRPGPYDRHDGRYGGMGMGMGGGYGGRGRGGRNVKGFFEEEFDDYGSFGGGNMGGGGGGFNMRNRRGGGGGGGHPPPMGPMRGGRGSSMMGGGGMGGGGERRGMQPGSCYISKTGHSVHMRGLPFQALEQDVFDFFSPIQPVRCEFEYNDNGRATGEANVDFATHQEAVEAMKKHKSNMQHRYIELFLNSEPNMRSGGGGGGGYGNGGFGGGNMGNDGYNDDMVPGFGGQNGQGSFGGGYGGNHGQGFGQQGFGNQGGFGGSQGFNQQEGMNYNMGGGGGGYDGMGQGNGMMGNNYTAF